MTIGANDIIALMQNRGRGDPTSALGEIFVTPLVRVLQYLDSKVQFSRVEQVIDTIVATLEDEAALDTFAVQLDESVATIQSELSSAVEALASNSGLSRRRAMTSSGTVLVYRSSPLTTPVTINSGRKFFAPLLNQEYVATETIQITSMTWNATLSKYVFPVPVQSVNTGLNTVAATNQVTQLKESLTNIDGCTNIEPIVGGRDEESDRDLANRTKTALSSNNIGTKSGYRFMVLALDEVKDASVVGAGDSLMIRDMGDGGSVDIYITDPVPVQVSETALLGTNLVDLESSGPGTGPWVFTPSRQPIINNVALVSPSADSLDKDTSAYAGSLRAQDTITFSTNVDTMTITYFVNDNVNQVQEYIDDDSRKILGSDVLVKEASVVLVNISMKISVLSGYSRSVVQGNVQNAITQFISSLGIGVSLEQSDVVREATNVPGVDRVDLPLIRFDRGTTPEQLNIISAAANEVLRVGSVSVSY
jgi:uncharacterized phage protein gp47/JayE